jgi:predicted GH43/DUF377 family glycosyl hydrolase
MNLLNWKKIGLVSCSDTKVAWRSSHAMVPTPLKLKDGVIRVFVSFCDKQGVARPGFVDVDETNPLRVLKISNSPLLDVGDPGTFDDNGVLCCSVVQTETSALFMYYVGFEVCTKIRYRLFTGVASSFDGGNTFEKISATPVLDRSDKELFFRGGPHCIYEDGKFRMWYVAGSAWEDIRGKDMPVYEIRYIESVDGINWPSEGRTQIAISNPDEHGFGRPYIFKLSQNNWSMFYSVRRRSLRSYRLGYAQSKDGMNWKRLDEKLSLSVTPDQFDSDAIMYAAPIATNDKVYLFYNGNDFGKDGFGVAELVR